MRIEAFKVAMELLKPIVDEHGLTEYKTGPIFGPDMVFTPVDQHLNATIQLADWLLEEEPVVRVEERS